MNNSKEINKYKNRYKVVFYTDKATYEKIRKSASENFRSISGQCSYLLSKSLHSEEREIMSGGGRWE